MDFSQAKDMILKELAETLSGVKPGEVDAFCEEILKARRVFVTGAGRVLRMCQAFAQRLRHLRIDSYVLGETIVPPIGKKDLLVAASGSGETATVLTIAGRGRKKGARLAVVTARRDSPLAALADCLLKIPGPTSLKRPQEPETEQPLTGLFEQSLLLAFDAVGLLLRTKKGLTDEEMWEEHANLE